MVAGYNYNTYGGQSSPWLQNIYERYFQPQSYTYNFVGNIEDAVENVNANIAKKIRAFTLPPKRNGQPSDWVSHYSRLIKTEAPKLNNQKNKNVVAYTVPTPVRKTTPKVAPKMEIEPGKAPTVTLSVDFVNRVKEIAQNINCDYRDLLGVINSESSFSTTIRSGGKRNGAVGLIQFTDIAIKDLNQTYGLNLTKDKISKMSAMEQLDLTKKYLQRCKSFKFSANAKLDSADLYAIVYRPAFAGKDIVAKKSDGEHYTKNKGLDVNKDGFITRNDLTQVVAKKRVNVNLVA